MRRIDGPVSATFGADRGRPVDRVYIEAFLDEHRHDVRGAVLEVKDDRYTREFGGDRVTRSDVVDVDSSNGGATMIVDLDESGSLPADTYDCIVLTQVMQFLHPQRALPNLYGALRPGGVALVSAPALCRLETRQPELWRLSAVGLEEMLRRELPADAEIETAQHGNAKTVVASLLGLAAEDLGASLGPDDVRYPLVSLARVRRP